MALDNNEIIKIRDELKDINVVYLAEGERAEENRVFFEGIFRKCYVIENQNDNAKMEDVGFVPELIILSSKVKGVDAEVVIKSYLNHKIVPEVLLFVTEDMGIPDFLKLHSLGITNYIEEDFNKNDFIASTRKILENLEYKRDKMVKENLVVNKRRNLKTPQDMNIIILEKSIPSSNVIKNLLIKNGAQQKNISIYRTIEQLLSHVRIQTKSSSADIVILGEDDADTGIEIIVKNIITTKKDTYILAMSSETSRSFVSNLMALGIKDVMIKPFEESVVSMKLDKALKMGEGHSIGLNRHLYNIGEIVEEYRNYRFLKKLTPEQSKLLEDYVIFLRRKR